MMHFPALALFGPEDVIGSLIGGVTSVVTLSFVGASL